MVGNWVGPRSHIANVTIQHPVAEIEMKHITMSMLHSLRLKRALDKVENAPPIAVNDNDDLFSLTPKLTN